MCAEQAIKIVRGMSSVEVMEPEPALFQVETSLRSGRPPRWTLNGKVLEPSAVVRMDREGTIHSLCFTSTESSMSGPVVFTAGKSHSTAKLTVKGEVALQEVVKRVAYILCQHLINTQHLNAVQMPCQSLCQLCR